MQTYMPQLTEPVQRWVRFFALLAALALLCWFLYGLRDVFTPVLAGLAIAYVLNPVVTWFERTQRVPRLVTVIVAFALLTVLVFSAGAYLGAKTIVQLQQFVDRAPEYRVRAERWLHTLAVSQDAAGPEADAGTSGVDGAPTSGPADELPAEPAATGTWWTHLFPLVERHGVDVARSSVSYLLVAMSGLASVTSLLVLTPLFIFYFLWRFNDMVRLVRDHLPAAYRDRIVSTVRTIDGAMANFFRGRLLVCLIVGALNGIGWSFVPGLQYAMLLGALSGILNLVPFMSLLAVPPALLFTYLGTTEAGLHWPIPVALAMGVYLVVQALESFVLSPIIEGQSSGLHPLAIVVALLIGAELAGLLGMLLAIPVTSTLKTFAGELVLPEIRRLAGHPATGPPGDQGDVSASDQVSGPDAADQTQDVADTD